MSVSSPSLGPQFPISIAGVPSCFQATRVNLCDTPIWQLDACHFAREDGERASGQPKPRRSLPVLGPGAELQTSALPVRAFVGPRTQYQSAPLIDCC